ncbi:MAG TPA: hypothetical protein VK524_10295 [Polyangiaceae bacterium]|nr:hypothetical protein [Polyangiaceae bacterium]
MALPHPTQTLPSETGAITGLAASTPSERGWPRARQWALITGMLVAALLALEILTRWKLFSASKDLSRFGTYPERARTLAAAKGKRVAFIGNSLTERGIDAERFGRATGVASDVFVADGSHVNTWYWIIEREFWKQGLKPDWIVMNFYETGLEDGKRIELGRLAQFFVDPQDWLELFRNDVTDLEPRVELVLSSFWATYAVRDRLKERALSVIPGYKPYIERVNDIDFRHETKQMRHANVRATRHALIRLCKRATEKGTPLLFVAFPSIGDRVPAYDVPHETTQVIQSNGHRYLDLRVVPELKPEHYADNVHLTPEGQAIYTKYLAERLKAYL